jgi:site-specific DNA-methyltransferase (adenine-specific)
MFDGLAQFAERVLCDGGSMVFYCGHLQLPAAFRAFSNLRHWWTCANVYEGGGAKAMMTEYGIRVCWKPLLWFVKVTRENKRDFVTDVNITPAKEKGWHDWQQTVADAEHWIKAICPAKGVICDPFLGGGTTAMVAEKLGLQWIGFEIDAETAALAGERITNG